MYVYIYICMYVCIHTYNEIKWDLPSGNLTVCQDHDVGTNRLRIFPMGNPITYAIQGDATMSKLVYNPNDYGL